MVLPLAAGGVVDAHSADLLTSVLVQELRRRGGLRVVMLREVEGTLNEEQRRQVAGCDTASCAAEIAAALDTDQVIMGSVGAVGENLVLTATRLEARSAAVLASSTLRIRGRDPGLLLDEAPTLAAELLGTRASSPRTAVEPPAPATGPPVTGAAPAGRRPVHARHIALLRPSELPGGDGLRFSDERMPVQGPGRARISWNRFYEEVGRSDLELHYRARGVVGSALLLVGIAGTVIHGGALVVGFMLSLVLGTYALIGGVILVSLAGDDPRVRYGLATVAACWLGAALLLVGGLLTSAGSLVAGLVLPRHPVDEADRLELAARHNSALTDEAPAR